MSEFFRDDKKTCRTCKYYTGADRCGISVWQEGTFRAPEPAEPGGYCYLWEGRDDSEDLSD
jgi:hypothetical protein